MTEDGKLFNRTLYRTRRARQVARWGEADFIKREAAARLAEALSDIARRFPLALDLASHAGEVAEAIMPQAERVIRCDYAAEFAPEVVCDEELLPFADDSFDLITSAMGLHHVNDLPGCLIQARRCLKPDGLLLALMPGARTLQELRAAWAGAAARHGFALRPRLSPMVEVRDAGALLQRAGFALPVVDSDLLTVEYASAWKLFDDLHRMGEANVLLAQSGGLASRAELAAVAAWYDEHFASDEGGVTATVEFITLSGWKPHDSQQKPALRGSGRVNLKDVL